jgi:hypothetical protein
MIAYFILVHRYPNQFKKLFTAIYDSKNHYLIHLDKKADADLYNKIEYFLEEYPNAHILKSQNVVWGGYSMVDVELKGIKKLLTISKKWDYFVNLSGQDYPLKSQAAIQKFLNLNAGSSFIEVRNQLEERPNTLNRIKNYFTESKTGFIGKPFKREYLPKVTPYIGGQWKVLTRECCEFISRSPEVAKFRKYYKNTLIPDEGFFQTVLMNTKFAGKIINDNKRAIIWIPDFRTKNQAKNLTAATTTALIKSGKIKLRPKTFMAADMPYLLASDALFARKFDETMDTTVFDSLEVALHISTQRVSKKPLLDLNNANVVIA